jgi:dihydrofolate synthase/folylpolyglutamate synthase
LDARVLAAMPSAVIEVHANIAEAMSVASAQSSAQDRILAFGSFFVAAAALQWARDNGWDDAEPVLAADKV